MNEKKKNIKLFAMCHILFHLHKTDWLTLLIDKSILYG